MNTQRLSNYRLRLLLQLPYRKGLSLLFILLLAALLSSCSNEDTLGNRYQDYLDRVANLLDRSPTDAAPLPAIIYPSRRDRLLDIPDFEQGLVEVWDFQRCGLMSLINQRNSNLGKVMRPSQRFIYENHFWQKLVPCYTKREKWLAEDSDFVRRLEDAYQHKKEIRPLVTHQLFFAGKEFERQFSQSQKAFLPNARPDYQRVATALRELARLAESSEQPTDSTGFSSPGTVNVAGLEHQLQIINSQPITHSLLKSLQITSHSLNQVSQLLENKLKQRPLCLNGGSTQRSKNLYNVLQKYYLQGIQPVIAHHARMANHLLPPLNQIFDSALKAAPDSSLRHFQNRWLSMQNPEGLWRSFQHANQRHTAVWNRLLRQCGLFPQRD